MYKQKLVSQNTHTTNDIIKNKPIVGLINIIKYPNQWNSNVKNRKGTNIQIKNDKGIMTVDTKVNENNIIMQFHL